MSPQWGEVISDKIFFVNRGSHSGHNPEYAFDGTAELSVLTNSVDHSYGETAKNCITVHATAEAVPFVTTATVFLICCRGWIVTLRVLMCFSW